MVLLKKVKGSTLMETLVATVLIMVIFMVASMILNNLFSNSIRNNTNAITSKLNEIEYLYINDKIIIPYYDDYKDWEISIESLSNSDIINFKATNQLTKKIIEKEIYKNEN
jgi:Tfp pilus assembly protein PilV